MKDCRKECKVALLGYKLEAGFDVEDAPGIRQVVE